MTLPGAKSRLGDGPYGETWLVEHDGKVETHKILRDVSEAKDPIFRDVLQVAKTEHPHIARVFGTAESDGRAILRSEYIDGESLGSRVEREGAIPVERLAHLALQVADALASVHERGLTHGALSPTKILVRRDREDVVVTGFGIEAALRRQSGNPRGDDVYYLAPELLADDRRSTPASDIWALGVTIYYLLSLDFPFPFGGMRPDLAVQEEPSSLSDRFLHISPEFWKILERMLRRDPAERVDSALQVRDDLDVFLQSVACPACGNVFRYDSVAGTCPEPACQSPRIASFSRALEARRRAETALSACRFEEAGREFAEAQRQFAESGSDEPAQDVADRRSRIPELEASIGKLADEVGDLLRRERLVDCVHALRRLRSRFAADPRARQLHAGVAGALRDLHDSAEPVVRDRLLDHDFAAAREHLTRLDLLVSDALGHRSLVAAIGREPTQLRHLYEEIEDKELTFTGYRKEARDAIAEFDFKLALKVYTRIETEFPSPRNAPMLAALRRGPAAYSYAIRYPEPVLDTVIADPGRLATSQKIRLKKVNVACKTLLEDWSVKEYPSFAKIERLFNLTSEACASTTRYVEDRLAEAKQAEQDEDIFLERRILRAIGNIVERSDLFTVETQQNTAGRLRHLEHQVNKVETLYRHAEAALGALEYVRAQTALEEVNMLVPFGYKDVRERLANLAAQRDRMAELQQSVTGSLREIARSPGSVREVTEAFRKSEDLYAISAESGREQLGPLRIAAAAAYLRDRTRSIGGIGATGAHQTLDRDVVPLLATMPPARWKELFDADAELRRAFCALLSAAYGGQYDPTFGLAVEVERAEQLVALLEPVREVLRAVAPPIGSTHIAVEVTDHLTDAFRKSRYRVQQSQVLNLIALTRRCAELANRGSQGELEATLERFQSFGTQGAIQRLAYLAKFVVPILVMLAGIGWALYHWL